MAADAERVRSLLGEDNPDGESWLSNDQITVWLTQLGSVEAAAAEGWRVKAGRYAELVDTAEGTSKRSMSDLHKNALAMVDYYSGASGSTQGRTRSHQIVRR